MMRSLLFLSLATAGISQTVTLTEHARGLRVEVDGQLFTDYVTDTPYHPHFYPIIGTGGVGITREYPLPAGAQDDHPHHASMWIGHGDVNGIDFWLEGSDRGRIQHTAFTGKSASGSTAQFTATAQWLSPAGDPILSDERSYTISVLADGQRQMDCAVTFIASHGEVTFGDTKEGTFAFRVCSTLSLEGQGAAGKILTSEGVKNKKAWGKPARWITYYGPDPKGNEVSLSVLDHPQNLRHPTPWHARYYGLLGANPFGLHDFLKSEDKTLGQYVLSKGQRLTQRYRVLLGKGTPQAEALQAAWTAFSQTK
jgi:hypothetical protein